GDDHELGIAARKADLDAARLDLSAELERRLPEEVEQVEMERRRQRLTHAASGLRRRVVTERGGCSELLLNGLDVGVELQCDTTMTSLMQSVKRVSDIAPQAYCKRRSRAERRKALELPDVAANDRRRRAVGAEAVDVDVLSSDHEVRMDCRPVDAGIEELVRRDLAAERLREPCAEGDMARRFLVEERVAEHEAGLLHGRRAVDEGEFAEVGCLLVGRKLLADDLCADLGVDLDDLAALETELETRDLRTRGDERVRRPDVALRAAPVGARENLLGVGGRKVRESRPR